MTQIIGIGTDIIECLRIAQMIERHGDLFIRRVYTDHEIAYCQERKAATQPYSSLSAGCVFRNPQGHHAGELIDRFGIKGLSCGGAQISEQHANFIVNANGRATASDVKSLVATVSEVIQRNIGVRMQTEVVIA